MTRLFRRLRTLFRWRKQEQDLHDELTAHVAMDAQERIEAGEPPISHGSAARRDFGNVARVAEDTRAAWGWTGVEQVLQDLRYAFRQLRRSPGFSAVVVATLALGIGGATAVFSVLQAVLLAPLPYEQPGQLVRFYQQEPDKPATGQLPRRSTFRGAARPRGIIRSRSRRWPTTARSAATSSRTDRRSGSACCGSRATTSTRFDPARCAVRDSTARDEAGPSTCRAEQRGCGARALTPIHRSSAPPFN